MPQKPWLALVLGCGMVTACSADSRPTTAAITTTADAIETSPSTAASLETCEGDGTWQCSSIEVPLDWEDPSGQKLVILFSVRSHDDQSQPPLEPVVLLNGGPGEAVLMRKDNLAVFTLHARHDIIALDQRGIGAGAIVCDDLQDGWASIEELRAANVACAQQLGHAADRYGSGDTARDIEAIRAQLDLPLLDFYTMSYGGVVATAYAARYPERVHAMVLDSPPPVTDESFHWEMGIGQPRAWTRVIQALCSRDSLCAPAYPDVDAVIEALLARVRTEPVVGTVNRVEFVADESQVVSLLGQVGPVMPISSPKKLLDAADRLLNNDDPDLLLRLVSDVGFFPEGGGDEPAELFSWGLRLAAVCNDGVHPFDRTAAVSSREMELAAYIAALSADVYEPASVPGYIGVLWPEWCLDWPAPERYEPVIPEGTSLPDVPVLVISGDIDPIVASEDAEIVASAFPNGIFASISGAWHGAALFPDESCAQLLVAEFLELLTVDPESCSL